ncbi:MAG TPA: histone deacetylase [Candidatus Binataceae bacterium]|nr:histone deacetylase [Candidatus Binataceae bacterium]
MNRTALIADRRYLKHFAGRYHPERPERVEALIEMAEGLTRDRFKLYAPRAATLEELALCHRPEYVETVERTAAMERYDFDPDTHTCSDTWMTAALASGGVLTATEAVIDGEADNAFAVVRPPGHHALPGRAMGFCFFNNVAIGAKWLIERRGLSRVLILDWDVHHGNGTQEMFYSSPNVLYMSTHQSPFYPGTGHLEETGTGAGHGHTVNLPLPAMFGDAEYLYGFDHLLIPIAREFNPEFVLISAGFDSHYRDPLGSMRVTEAGFAAMTQRLKRLANECCGGKLVAVLEGGYDLKALADSGRAVIEELGRDADERIIKQEGPNRVAPIIQRALYFRDQFCHNL